MKSVKIFFLVAVASLLMSSCVKKTESYLEGQWKRVNLRGVETKIEVWEFNGGTLSVYHLDTLTSPNTLEFVDKGSYKVQLDGANMSFETTGFISDGDHDMRYNSKYSIYKKRKDILGFMDTRGWFYEFNRYEK